MKSDQEIINEIREMFTVNGAISVKKIAAFVCMILAVTAFISLSIAIFIESWKFAGFAVVCALGSLLSLATYDCAK